MAKPYKSVKSVQICGSSYGIVAGAVAADCGYTVTGPTCDVGLTVGECSGKVVSFGRGCVALQGASHPPPNALISSTVEICRDVKI